MAEEINTEVLLVNSFKDLMMEIPFKKITIKKITDGAGVIRPTFYNYFSDKYMVFEYILDEELFSTLYSLVEINMLDEIVPVIFAYFDKHKDFYRKSFNIDDEFSFKEIFTQKGKQFILHLLRELPLKNEKDIESLGMENVAQYYTLGLVQVIDNYCNNGNGEYDVDFYKDAYTYLASHTFPDLFEGLDTDYS